jgi:hypothetical protein
MGGEDANGHPDGDPDGDPAPGRAGAVEVVGRLLAHVERAGERARRAATV